MRDYQRKVFVSFCKKEIRFRRTAERLRNIKREAHVSATAQTHKQLAAANAARPLT